MAAAPRLHAGLATHSRTQAPWHPPWSMASTSAKYMWWSWLYKQAPRSDLHALAWRLRKALRRGGARQGGIVWLRARSGTCRGDGCWPSPLPGLLQRPAGSTRARQLSAALPAQAARLHTHSYDTPTLLHSLPVVVTSDVSSTIHSCRRMPRYAPRPLALGPRPGCTARRAGPRGLFACGLGCGDAGLAVQPGLTRCKPACRPTPPCCLATAT